MVIFRTKTLYREYWSWSTPTHVVQHLKSASGQNLQGQAACLAQRVYPSAHLHHLTLRLDPRSRIAVRNVCELAGDPTRLVTKA